MNCYVFLITSMIVISSINFCAASYEDDLLTISRGLEKVASFYSSHYKEVNLDSIFGLRAAEGTLHHLFTKHEDKIRKLPTHIFTSIEKSFISIRISAAMGYQILDKENDQYLQSFRYIVDKKWFHESNTRLPLVAEAPSSSQIVKANDELDEKFSDKCMKGLLGTSSTKKKCTVEDDCWSVMNKEGNFGYTITHQALFFMLGISLGCKNVFQQKLGVKTKLEDRLHIFGSDIYNQMQEISRTGYPVSEHDLFLEQAVVSSWLGIKGSMNMYDTFTVLSWQNDIGCYKEPKSNTQNTGQPSVDEVKGPSRRLQEERTLKGGCLSHTTGLLVAYLAESIHWQITKELNQPGWSLQYLHDRFKEGQYYYQLLFYWIPLLLLASYFWRQRKKRRKSELLQQSI
ncbi:UPF0764 protein C16orf89 homolog isoform X1 [Clytia hemisphaerica]|uniref:Uncharacterized protein n=1 Tax=Clytia hemisphaerica TaxID=252671 RepID=A0A7M5X6N7_9CNID